jgi:hypothetical protein
MSETVRRAYADAGRSSVDTVARIEADRWDGPGLEAWTMRGLVGHASRALLTVDTYLAKPAATVEIERPVDYFIRALWAPGAPFSDEGQLFERGAESGRALGDDPQAAVRALAARVLALTAATPDDAILGTPVGGIRLVDYLPSRVFELTVHTLDIARVLGLEVTPPSSAYGVSIALLGDLALYHRRAPELLLAATGRAPLPGGFSLI